MWGRLCLLWIFIWAADTAPKTTICPEKCECSMSGEGLKAHCSSIEFLSKLVPKQIQQIIELDLSDTSLKRIDNKLKKLRNLKKLDVSKNQIKSVEKFPDLPHLTHLYLSQNRIQNFTAIDLPKSITNIDLSSNNIRNITDITKNLPKLAELNINSNPLSCDCDFLKYRDLLLHYDVFVVRPMNCHTPEYVKDISMLSVYCASGKVTYDDWEQMLRDDGSGDYSAISRTSLDVVDFDKSEDNETVFDRIEGEYFQTKIENTSTETEEDSFEGSGSSLFDVMGSGDGSIPVRPDPNVSHCYYNCSTPAPIDDSNKSAPAANIGQEITKFFSELAGKKEESTTSTTAAPIVEIQISKTMLQETGSDKSRASVEPPKDFPTTESAKKDNTTTYIVVAVLFAAMVVLIAYVVIKKRSSRNNRPPVRNNEVKEPPPVEMKPLLSEKPVAPKPVTVPEMTPLMNGQNGTKKDSEAEPEDVPDSKPPPIENGIDVPEEETQLRPKKDEEPLVTTPGTKRVTIQAKELSSPKSPVLVHRHVGDDGKIIISPPISKNEKYT